MKQQEVFKKIGGIIKELNDQYEFLKTVDGQLNELELELFIANSHFLTDHVVILSKLNSQLKPAKTPVEEKVVAEPEKPVEKPEPVKPEAAKPTEEPRYFEPLVQSATQAVKNRADATDNNVEDNPVPHFELENGSADDTYSFIREEPETIRHELILDEADLGEDDEQYENALAEKPVEEIHNAPVPEEPEPVKEQVKPPAHKPAAPAVKEVAKEDVLTINEKISAQMGDKNGARGEQLHSQAISDLKAAINLNDNLLYVKELFNGYSLAYSEAIEILNRFNSFDEAELFLKKNYTVKNNWDDKPETTGKFYDLLKRRYA